MRYTEIKNIISKYFNDRDILPQGLKAVLFDMDGVLFDSMPAHAKAWQQVMNEYGLITSLEEFYMYEGQTASQTINIVFKRNKDRKATDNECKEIYKRKTELFIKYNETKIIDGINEVLSKLEDVRKIIVTGSSQPSLIDRIDKVFPNIFELENIVTGKNVSIGKPSPEPYLKGLKLLGVKPSQAMVIENAPMGVRSAVASDIFTIAVNTGIMNNDILLKEKPNLLYSSMRELSDDIQCITKSFT